MLIMYVHSIILSDIYLKDGHSAMSREVLCLAWSASLPSLLTPRTNFAKMGSSNIGSNTPYNLTLLILVSITSYIY